MSGNLGALDLVRNEHNLIGLGQIPLEFEALSRPTRKPTATAGQLHEVVGLFAGIGGLELGLSRAGHSSSLLCEIDAAAAAVLNTRFPTTALHSDVRTLKSLPRATSLVAAGFPCQDLSQAGTTRGIEGARSGLVGEVFRLVEKQRTPWVLLENVPFMLQLARGNAMNVIATAFEELGYRWAYRVVDSRTFGLPQRRRRVYFVASRVGDPRSILFADESRLAAGPVVSNSKSAFGFYWTEGLRGLGWAVDAVPTLKGGSTIGIPSPPAIWLPNGNIVTPDIRDAERLQGFVANWTKPAELVAKRGARWKLVGNAVSVRAASWIGQRLAKPGRILDLPMRPLHDHCHWPTAACNVDGRRLLVLASEWPVQRKYQSLNSFLRYATNPLSAKATAGFLSRAEQASLRFPPGFLDAIREHLDRQLATTSRVASARLSRAA